MALEPLVPAGSSGLPWGVTPPSWFLGSLGPMVFVLSTSTSQGLTCYLPINTTQRLAILVQSLSLLVTQQEAWKLSSSGQPTSGTSRTLSLPAGALWPPLLLLSGTTHVMNILRTSVFSGNCIPASKDQYPSDVFVYVVAVVLC